MLCLMSLESLVPLDHPLRGIRQLADEALSALSEDFDAMYAEVGRPSVPPERLLKASLLIALFSVRSERQLCEQLRYNMLFRWFLDMDMVEEPFDATSFTKNRARLMEHDVAAAFFFAIRHEASDLMSREHFSVDGTLIEAWASMKSFRPKDDHEGDNNGWGDFRGKSRKNVRARVEDRPRVEALSQGPRSRGEALLRGTRAHGESTWASRGPPHQRGQRARRARHCARHAACAR